MLNLSRKRFRLRIVLPAYPAFNIYSRIARETTALGPVCVASAVNEMERRFIIEREYYSQGAGIVTEKII